MFKQVLQLKIAIKIIHFFFYYYCRSHNRDLQDTAIQVSTNSFMIALGRGNDNDCENQGTDKKTVVDWYSAEPEQPVLIFSQILGSEFKSNYSNTRSLADWEEKRKEKEKKRKRRKIHL